jgi:hypothetical protein
VRPVRRAAGPAGDLRGRGGRQRHAAGVHIGEIDGGATWELRDAFQGGVGLGVVGRPVGRGLWTSAGTRTCQCRQQGRFNVTCWFLVAENRSTAANMSGAGQVIEMSVAGAAATGGRPNPPVGSGDRPRFSRDRGEARHGLQRVVGGCRVGGQLQGGLPRIALRGHEVGSKTGGDEGLENAACRGTALCNMVCVRGALASTGLASWLALLSTLRALQGAAYSARSSVPLSMQVLVGCRQHD